MTGLLVCVAVLATASVFGLFRARRDGRVRAVAARGRDEGVLLSAADLGEGVELGERATLVQFSTAFCQPCRATRRVLAEVAAMVAGVAHVEIDAERHLELVRRLEILRTPTVLVLDPEGRVVKRAAGQPRRADVIAALGEAG
ncbi:thioredoxin family protein [Kitasatospora sp. NBC_01287]|uniref:TlpA family protein disulfide reductase n=1 Tax=Kitasatospora sp. NBC_01287 TaxID=2903573 RepID=UPI00224D6AAC|nr:thioredoxin family protein [Kitasatospora sp. NBC_01287]MCX4750677.1 thioredoxin family protein [Kitasatospora sp. NBC_01287]